MPARSDRRACAQCAAAASGRRRLSRARAARTHVRCRRGRVVIGSLAVQRAGDGTRAGSTNLAPSASPCRSTSDLVDGAPMVATAGWTEDSRVGACGTSRAFILTRAISCVTDIGRDGMLDGPNFDSATTRPQRACRTLRVQASGGVSSLADLAAPARPTARSSARRCGKAAFRSRRRVGLAGA